MLFLVYFVSVTWNSSTWWRQMMPRSNCSHMLLAWDKISYSNTLASYTIIMNSMASRQSNPWPVLTWVPFNGLVKLCAKYLFSFNIMQSNRAITCQLFHKMVCQVDGIFPSYTVGALCPPIYNIVVTIRCQVTVEHETQLPCWGS